MTHLDRRDIGFVLFAAVVLLLLFALVDFASPQTNMGPIRTPQINTNLYVGQSGYATIQSAVTHACRTGNNNFVVVIQQGMNPPDQIANVTGGCAGTFIDDYRTNTLQRYKWSGTAYTPFLPFAGGNATYTNFVVATHGELDPTVPGLPTLGVTWIDAPNAVDYGRLVYTSRAIGTYGGLSLTGLARQSTGSPLAHEYLHCGPANNFLCLFAGDVNIQGALNIAGHPISTIAATSNLLMGDNNRNAVDSTIAPANVPLLNRANDFSVSQQILNSPICTEATGCPGATVGYPAAGIGVSTGSAWSPNSIDPATVPRTNTTNTFTPTQTFTGPEGIHIVSSTGSGSQLVMGSAEPGGGFSPITQVGDALITANAGSLGTGALAIVAHNNSAAGIRIDSATPAMALFGPITMNGSTPCTAASPCPGTTMTYPPAGVAVSTGTAWTTSIPSADIARLSAANLNFTGNIQAQNITPRAAIGVSAAMDLNTITGCGEYFFPNSWVNGPSGIDGHYNFMKVQCSGDGAWAVQTLFNPLGGTAFYVRVLYSQNWSGWSLYNTITPRPATSLGGQVVDLNSLRDCGTWWIANGQWTNGPGTEDLTWSFVRMDCSGDQQWGVQSLYGPNGQIYNRFLFSGQWRGWVQVSEQVPTLLAASISPSPLTANGSKSKTVPVSPRASKQTCRKDAMWHDEEYIYVCVKNGEIKRAALADF